MGWKVKTRTHPLNGGLLRNVRRGQGMGTMRSSGRGVAARRLLACRRSIPDLLAEAGVTLLFASRQCFGPRARASLRHLPCKLQPRSSQLRIQGFLSSRRSTRPSRQNVAHANGDQNQRQERGLLQHPRAAARLRDRERSLSQLLARSRQVISLLLRSRLPTRLTRPRESAWGFCHV